MAGRVVRTGIPGMHEKETERGRRYGRVATFDTQAKVKKAL
jgi:hypothetical protein